VRLVALAALLLALAARAATAAPPPATLDRFDGVVPRMSVAQVERALGVELDVQTLPGSSCGTAPFRLPGGVAGYALFLHRRLGSLWFDRGARTDRGIRIGSSVAALRRAYPRLRSRPDKYVPGARSYFVRRAKAPHWRLRFDVSAKGKVTAIAFGGDSVFLVEGCA
jgi:hypothetical protein